MPRKSLTREQLRELRQRVSGDMQFAVESKGVCSVRVSGGNASAVMLFRCLELFGRDRVSAVFADTNSEHPDLYRFIDDVERVSGIEIVRLNDGRDIFDVFDETGIMRIVKSNACKASLELKRKPLNAHSDTLGPHVTAIGMDWTEPERIYGMRIRTDDSYVFPLAIPPRLSECEYRDFLKERGIEPSTLYGEGFMHNNCGGGCVQAGLAQWAHHYRTHPERFAKDEKREAVFIEKTGFTILRDQRGGTTTNYSLSDLRRDVDAGRTFVPMKVPLCQCMYPMNDGEQLDLF